MSQKIKDGIVIDNTVYMMDEKKTGFPVLMRCLQFLAVILGSFNAISILANCFDLPIIQKYISLVVLIAGILIYTMILYPTYDWIKLTVSIIIYLILLRKFFHQLQNGFYLLENAILNRAGNYYGMTVIPYKAQHSSMESDITLLMIMIIIPLIALLAYAIVRSRLLSICDIVLLLPVATSFAMGVTPTEASLITYILVMIYMTRSYGSGQASYKEQKFMLHRIHNRSALVLCLVILGLFQIMKLVVPEEKYETMDGIKEAKVDIQDFLFNFSWEDFTDRVSEIEWLPSRKGGSGGLNSGKLGRVDQVNYSESEQLEITVPLKAISEGIYLKGFVGTTYTGDSWEEHSKEEKQQYKELEQKLPSTDYAPANISTDFVEQLTNLSSIRLANTFNNVGQPKAFEFNKGTIQVRYTGANKNYIYAPYLTDFEAAEASEYRSDLYAAPLSKKGSYEFDFYYNLNMGEDFANYLKAADNYNLASYTEFERLYRDYVYDVYTKLPVTGLDRLKSDFTRDKVGSRADSIDKAVSYVKDYLQSNAQYTLSPGKLPKGKDFVEYFIYENKVGYCSHFASAGVLMLRALGYPARYVEGYAVNSSDIQYDEGVSSGKTTNYSDQYTSTGYDSLVEVAVKDYCAHAWAEVYIDGCGWFPVEFTPAASIENTESTIEDMADASQGITQEDNLQLTPTPTVTPKPTEAPEDNNQATPTVTPFPKADQTGGDNNGSNNQNQGGKQVFYGLLFSILAAAAISVLVLFLLQFRRRRLLEHMDNRSRKAIYRYKEIERLLRLNNALPKKGRSLEDYLEQVRENCPYIDAKEFESCMETVRKARFGRNTISEEELQVVEYFYDSLQKKVLNGVSPIKRTYLKMILSI